MRAPAHSLIPATTTHELLQRTFKCGRRRPSLYVAFVSDHTGGATMESRTISLLLLFVLIGIHWPVVAESMDPAVPESACPSHPAVISADADPDARKTAASHARLFVTPTFDYA